MAKPKSHLHVLTANRLTDGIVVFWSGDSKWTEWINQAELAEDAAWKAYLERVGEVAEARNIVVEPYLVPVSRKRHQIEPLHIREKFRTLGPSVRLDLGKQAELAALPAAELAAQNPALIAAE